MKTFSSIYPFTNRLELRRATCITSGAEGGGGGMPLHCKLEDEILKSICERQIDEEINLDSLPYLDESKIVREMAANGRTKEQVKGAIKNLIRTGKMEPRNPPLINHSHIRVTGEGFRHYAESLGMESCENVERVAKALLTATPARGGILTVGNVRKEAKQKGIPPLMTEYCLERLEDLCVVEIDEIGKVGTERHRRVIIIDKDKAEFYGTQQSPAPRVSRRGGWTLERV